MCLVFCLLSANTDQKMQAINMNASVSVESPEEQHDRLSYFYITTHGNIGYQNEDFGGHTSVFYDTISSSRGRSASATAWP